MSTAFIVLVDDDPAMLASTGAMLREFCTVESHPSASEALDALETLVPDAIVSDIVMPGIGGFEFRRLYAKRYSDRRTPFLFLSSLADTETVVAGLEAGADDFLVKPVAPELLRARVRAALRRSSTAESTFRGELSALPFVALMQFCEAKGMNGELTVEAEGLRVSLPLRGGELDPALAEPWIDRLCGLEHGTFVLRSAPVDLRELRRAGGGRESSAGVPAGRISAIRVRERLLRVQTELVTGDATTVVSLVLAGDEPIAKVRRTAQQGLDAAALQQVIDAQHDEVLASTHDRVSAARQRLGQDVGPDAPENAGDAPDGPAAETPAAPQADPGVDRAALLFDDGYERFRAGDWAGALSCWERALELNPASRTLAINIAVAKRKLEARGLDAADEPVRVQRTTEARGGADE